MRAETYLKVGQIAGALLMAGGVAACQLRDTEATGPLFLAGGLLYALCRIAHWLRQK